MAISSVTTTAPGTTAIRFVVSGEVAEGAIVTRDLDGVGVPRIVEELEGPLDTGVEYTVLDSTAGPGLHSYRVRVGRQTNSATSGTVEITNE